ncbi:MAG: diguanylate cyclase, partial [bacterium]|nr:diguanylate cyclase [bacterium]
MANDILKNELFESFANASDNIYIYVCDMKADFSRWSKNTVEYFDLEGEYIEGAGPKWMERIHP